MFTHVYVCIYVYMSHVYVCIYVPIYTDIHTYIHIHTHIYAYIYIVTCHIQERVYVYVCVYSVIYCRQLTHLSLVANCFQTTTASQNDHCTADVPVFNWCSDLPTKHCLRVYTIEYIPLYLLI